MKNVRKIVGLVMDEYVKTNPPPKDLGFTDEEVRAGTEELLDVLEAVVSVADSLRRIAEAVEAHNVQMMNIEMNTRPKR